MIAILALLMLGSGIATWWTITSLTTRPSAGSIVVPAPQMVVLTDRPSATVSYAIHFHSSSTTGPAGSSFKPPVGDMPVGVREIDLTIQAGQPQRDVRFVLLLNADAELENATSVYRLGDIAVTIPGSDIDSSCEAISTFRAKQVLSGIVKADDTGLAKVRLAGGVPPKVRYERSGVRTAVNVMQVLPASNVSPSGAQDGCNANLINWEQVGGIAWNSPILGAGSIDIADVNDGDFVESANPPLTNSRSLSWQFQGSVSVTYTIFHTDAQNSREVYLLITGAVAGLAGALLLEVLKSSFELARSTTSTPTASSTPPIESSDTTIQHGKEDSTPAGTANEEVRLSATKSPGSTFYTALGFASGVAIAAYWFRRKNHRW